MLLFGGGFAVTTLGAVTFAATAEVTVCGWGRGFAKLVAPFFATTVFTPFASVMIVDVAVCITVFPSCCTGGAAMAAGTAGTRGCAVFEAWCVVVS